MTPYQKHKNNWQNCKRCELHKQRNKVVLVRGSLPAPILFVGEAPGVSEDTIGVPFIGPAGKLLDSIIEQAFDGQWDYALTNLVGCIPKDESGHKTQEPSKECIKACAPRLKEVVHLCKPRLLVLLGKLSQKSVYGQAQFSTQENYGFPWLVKDCFLEFVHLIHPAAILRLDVSQESLAIQRSIVTLSDAVDNLTQSH